MPSCTYLIGNHAVCRFCSDNAPELELACTTLGIVQETSRAGVLENNSVIERTSLDILEGIRNILICAGLPECFWPFAAQHFCFLENTSAIGVDGKVFKDGSPYNRAHGKGEVDALRLPFGCAFYFTPADTKGFPKGKFEGSGEAGVIAGYNMSPAYAWDGEYLCWSLKGLAGISMMAQASKHPPGLQRPHVTKKVHLPSGNSCHFPLKEKYDRQFRSNDGPEEFRLKSKKTVMSLVILSVPKNTSTWKFPTLQNLFPLLAEAAVVESHPRNREFLNIMDVHLGVGYEFNAEGHLCRGDVINRLYKVGEYGKRITSRKSTCPPHLDSETWWRTFSPEDRIKWYVDMKTRELDETKAREAIASSEAQVIPPVEVPEVSLDAFIDTDTGHGGPWLSDAEWADMRERATASANRATPALLAAPKKRNNNPVHKIKQLGIAGLFSDENEAFIHDGSDSEASTSGAAPASPIESDEDEVPPWESLEEELELENNICATAQTSPQMGYDYAPSMPCVANYKGEPHRPKTVPYNSHSWITLNACVARPVNKKELLQSPKAQASMGQT